MSPPPSPTLTSPTPLRRSETAPSPPGRSSAGCCRSPSRGVFALTGAIGPILGQNYGAGRGERVSSAFTDALIFTAIYTGFAWAALAAFHADLSAMFNASGDTAALVRFFCLWMAPLFGFLGAQFVANAAFNNLGRPQFSTLLNWGRATVGTVPFVALGAEMFGPAGVLAGNMAGGVIFGVISTALCYKHISKVA
ncbi:MAG: MATE family efflux transporter [Hyphomicrobiales bacterium]|nr:MATE family efflux transporter [Hyphomicrobiales bacterium]